VPGTVSYLANLATLYWLGLSLGINREHLSPGEAQHLRRVILDVLGQVRNVAQRNESKVERYVEQHSAPQPLVLVGGGPNWATAHFGVAKLLEASLVLGVVQELEEWAHEQYFLTGPDLHTILIGADGISADRLEPTAHAVAGLQAPLAVIQPESMDLGVEAAAVWTYPSDVSELLSPIVTAVPLELLAHSLAAALDRHPFDYDNPTRRSISEKTIYRDGESAQVISRRNQPGAQ
jgi:glucosamine 6-phosphate synthetase-like amidotransferase/phosphosugar isomerase protein